MLSLCYLRYFFLYGYKRPTFRSSGKFFILIDMLQYGLCDRDFNYHLLSVRYVLTSEETFCVLKMSHPLLKKFFVSCTFFWKHIWCAVMFQIRIYSGFY